MAESKFDMMRMFKGVSGKWRSLLLNSDQKMDSMLVDVIKNIEGENITPGVDQILEFARLTSLDMVKVVVIGQDPYFTPGTAHGISFSSKDAATPKSLLNIFKALVKSGLLKSIPKTNELSNWCRQGFLMMNSAWTTRVGAANTHQDYWTKYSDMVIKSLSAFLPAGTIWLLWGGDAKKKAGLIDAKKHEILEYCHPVARPPNDFTDCPHFTAVAKRYPDFVWSLDTVETHWFTDGACSNNQNAQKARAAWGVKCAKGPSAGKTFGGAVLTAKIMKYDVKLEKEIESDARPTNIRAEALALINAMEQILKSGLYGKHIIWSDSDFWINKMYKEHIPNWLSAGLAWSKHANADLAERFWNLTQQVQKLGVFEFQFVNAWHDWKPKTEEERYKWQGNKDAEEAAEKEVPKDPDTEKGEKDEKKTSKFNRRK